MGVTGTSIAGNWIAAAADSRLPAARPIRRLCRSKQQGAWQSMQVIRARMFPIVLILAAACISVLYFSSNSGAGSTAVQSRMQKRTVLAHAPAAVADEQTAGDMREYSEEEPPPGAECEGCDEDEAK